MSEFDSRVVSADSTQTVKDISIPLFQAKGWMKLLGDKDADQGQGIHHTTHEAAPSDNALQGAPP
jgi:hypothetical protein